MILCIVGQIAAGKSTVAELMRKKGYKIIEMGDVVREEMEMRGLEVDSKSLRNFATELRSAHGNDIVARLALKKLKKIDGNKVAITGMRSTYEEAYFKKNIKNLIVVAVLAPERIRFERVKKRRKPDDPKSINEFRNIEKKELRGFSKGNDLSHGIQHAIETADYVLLNTGTPSQLKKDVYQLLKAIEYQDSKKNSAGEHAYNEGKDKHKH
ncbi:MAG: AAA family ATPase [Candidatus Micrarchaeaceae archaeon]